MTTYKPHLRRSFKALVAVAAVAAAATLAGVAGAAEPAGAAIAGTICIHWLVQAGTSTSTDTVMVSTILPDPNPSTVCLVKKPYVMMGR
jgi:hypothetical protein